ncbi:hypothetical protein GHK48_30830 [Sinorhizobium fredii]|uniref:Uncharacterized protein n=1 Tax=Rhizobium fredii TaxID=380 RepID=A0A844AHC6_RHIFR|nr:hypothetical protein [Sinorhizobium fredii]MQX12499.1 hypothetical protein [Sinorhizobium fredii]UTY47672.1 hypothetical protein EPK84_13160 [Sinorhizobium fredii]CEO91414.1 hypothetical membrane protein [Sinorhizobium fredii HH103]
MPSCIGIDAIRVADCGTRRGASRHRGNHRLPSRNAAASKDRGSHRLVLRLYNPVLSVTLVFASVLSFLTGDRFTALMLAYSPGNVAEISLISLSLGVEMPYVVLHQIVRLFLVAAGAAAVFRWVKR